MGVTKGKGVNDGTYKGIRYFETENGGKTGRFTSLQLDKVNIIKSTPTNQSVYHYHWGEVVYCTETKCKATVRSIGVPSWSDSGNVYYGLELAKKKGDHNGSYEGVSYFKCKAKYGIYVESDEVDHSEAAKRTKRKKQKRKKEEDIGSAEMNQQRADKLRKERKERINEIERQEQESKDVEENRKSEQKVEELENDVDED